MAAHSGFETSTVVREPSWLRSVGHLQGLIPDNRSGMVMPGDAGTGVSGAWLKKPIPHIPWEPPRIDGADVIQGAKARARREAAQAARAVREAGKV